MTASTRRPIRTAEIVAVGSELLTPFRTDTNSLFIAARLEELGIALRVKAVVGDDPGDLGAVFDQARARVDLVVLTGGLGPTADDVTREVVAGALGRPLVEDPELLAALERRFASFGVKMPAINRKQAHVPRGAMTLTNPRGTAPGLWMEEGTGGVLLLPGPPRELEPMLTAFVADVLAARTGAARLHRRVLKIAGRSESSIEEVAQPIYGAWLGREPPICTTILAAPGQVELHLSTLDEDAARAEARLGVAVDELAPVLKPGLFTTEGRSLEAVVGDALRARGLTIAVGESCTGGLITSRLTDVPGSSAYLLASIVSYSNRAKTELADVPAEMIAGHGAVSEPVAAAMAEGARRRAGADIGVGVTGVAGPGGGTPGKPVGTVVIAVAGPERAARVKTFTFRGERAVVKLQASQMALEQVRRMLAGEG